MNQLRYVKSCNQRRTRTCLQEFKVIFLMICAGLAVNGTALAVEQRVALVIGNATYTNSPLKNPVNDATDVAAKLSSLGFQVVERRNLTSKQIGGTLREFRAKLQPGAVAVGARLNLTTCAR